MRMPLMSAQSSIGSNLCKSGFAVGIFTEEKVVFVKRQIAFDGFDHAIGGGANHQSQACDSERDSGRS